MLPFAWHYTDCRNLPIIQSVIILNVVAPTVAANLPRHERHDGGHEQVQDRQDGLERFEDAEVHQGGRVEE